VQELGDTVAVPSRWSATSRRRFGPPCSDFGSSRGGEPGKGVPEAQRHSSALKFLGTEAQLAEDKSIMMFRIVQESLTNISPPCRSQERGDNRRARRDAFPSRSKMTGVL